MKKLKKIQTKWIWKYKTYLRKQRNMRKDRVWMKFKKEDFNQLMGVLSKQMERYSEIEAQNLNLKADIKDEKECLLDLQNKIWRY